MTNGPSFSSVHVFLVFHPRFEGLNDVGNGSGEISDTTSSQRVAEGSVLASLS